MTKETYVTSSLFCAAYCMLRGAEVVGVQPGEGTKYVIVLGNEGDRAWQAATEFYEYEPLVPLHALMKKRGHLMALIKQARAEVAA